MSSEILSKMSAFDIFSQGAETLDDAKRKVSEETRVSTKYLRLSQDGTISVRVLPLAPVIDSEGNVTMPRKGYEYPIKELVLNIKGKDAKGKEKTNFVSVCNAQYKFPQLKDDPIDLYVRLACEKYADDEALCKKIGGKSFDGGLRYDSKRCMYVLDMDKRGDGIQVLQLSYAQYKELEERKIVMWEKLIKKNPKALCPISSIDSAYPLEIKRSTENKKVSYSFNIDTISGEDVLSEEELQKLLDTPRLPETLYRYSRYHLEAVIAYLQQYDETMDIDIMSSTEMQDCIDQIKMLLPADDKSHFSITGGGKDEGSNGSTTTIDDLWTAYDSLEAANLDDKTEEGQELRASIREFIEANELDIRIGRRDSNYDLLNAIEDALEGSKKEEPAEEEDEEPATPAKEEAQEEEEEDEEPATPATSRNDDTNEPAARPSRRAARPVRRH